MKKNPLVLLLSISAGFFVLFLLFVYFAMNSFIHEGSQNALLSRGGTSIAVISLNGVIMDSTKILKQLETFEEDSSIKGIILRINSPGGAVAPSQEIHDAVLRVRKSKPVVASFESLAASGGYYVAVACDKIVTNPGTMTGSIGVIMDFTNLGDLYKWAKVERFNIKSGKMKDFGSENRPMTAEEKAFGQELVNNVYLQFVHAVSVGRKLPEEKVKELADGRVYTGEQAFKFGLADKLGGIDVAKEEMKALAKIKGKINLVYPEVKHKGVLELLGSGAAEGLMHSFFEQLGPQLQEGLQHGFSNSKSLYFL